MGREGDRQSQRHGRDREEVWVEKRISPLRCSQKNVSSVGRNNDSLGGPKGGVAKIPQSTAAGKGIK